MRRLEVGETRVLGTEPIGAYVLVRLAADGVEVGGPGRFAMARDPRGAAFLPRPVGLLARGTGEVAMLVDPTLAVGALAAARTLRILSPLGRGFDLDGARAASTLLVSGGIGITAVVAVPALLGGRPRLLAGFRDAGQAAAAGLVDADCELAIAPRLVSGPLSAALAAGDVERVLCAGPAGMARAVAAACATAGVSCQVALEAPMACGFGACHGCVVRLDGGWQRLCLEGPVVDGSRILA